MTKEWWSEHVALERRSFANTGDLPNRDDRLTLSFLIALNLRDMAESAEADGAAEAASEIRSLRAEMIDIWTRDAGRTQ